MSRVLSVCGVAVLVASYGACLQLAPQQSPVIADLLAKLPRVLSAIGAFSYSVWLLGNRSLHFLDKEEQLRVHRFVEVSVHRGPGLIIINPFGYRTAEREKGEMLGKLDYLIIKDTVSALERVERGPKLFFLDAYDKIASRGQGVSLLNTEYVLVEDLLSGEKTVVQGPDVWYPDPHVKYTKRDAISLRATEYLVVEDQRSGTLSTIKGPKMLVPGPYEKFGAKQTAVTLEEDQYVRLKDVFTGKRWVQTGKALVFLEPTWKLEASVQKAWVLKAHEYVRLLDRMTGKITVHSGEKTVFPEGHEEILDGGKKEAVVVDDEHAALVRNKMTGALRLVTEKQLFVPGPNEEIEGVRELIRLADHEAIIMKDQDGVLHFYYGSEARRAPNQPRSFFLPPHCELLQNWWSRGARRERKDVSFDRFDLRPHFMKFEFNCRTLDNVELILEGVFFWELVDLPTMIRITGDTSGDIVYHIRSLFTMHVAQVTLKGFMEQLHLISKKVLGEDTKFYATRGLVIHSLEVTRYQCADKSTSEILEQIIQETTNRMNRLSQAESENEVSIFRTKGQIEQSRQNTVLLEIQHQQKEAEACVTGKAEADQVAAFLNGLERYVPELEQRVNMWQTLRKTDALSVVSNGSANLYYTPNDVDLRIEVAQTDAAGQ